MYSELHTITIMAIFRKILQRVIFSIFDDGFLADSLMSLFYAHKHCSGGVSIGLGNGLSSLCCGIPPIYVLVERTGPSDTHHAISAGRAEISNFLANLKLTIS
jgi:hypothetical protein